MSIEHSNESRHFSRIPFHADVQLHFMLPNMTQIGSLRDISLKGVLVETLHPINTLLGKACRMHLILSAGEEKIIMEGTVAHHEDNLVGIDCKNIDVDSMTNLRRLIEINMGDEGLLKKELFSMFKIEPGG